MGMVKIAWEAGYGESTAFSYTITKDLPPCRTCSGTGADILSNTCENCKGEGRHTPPVTPGRCCPNIAVPVGEADQPAPDTPQSDQSVRLTPRKSQELRELVARLPPCDS